MNKDICRRCVNENFPKPGWSLSDEERWDNCFIWCSVSTLRFNWKKHGIPCGCRYALEQVVLDNDSTPGDTQ